MNYKFVIAHGLIGEGLKFTGPFDTAYEAVDYACDHFHENWEIITIKPPEWRK
jgi:hypothetical protein